MRLTGKIYLLRQELSSGRGSGRAAITVLCLGESTTALGGPFSYPAQLERILNASESGRRFRVLNRGVAGTNTTVIMENLDYNLDLFHPDVVVAMIGINDGLTTRRFRQKPSWTEGSFGSLRLAKLARLILCGATMPPGWANTGNGSSAGMTFPAKKDDLLRAARQHQGSASAAREAGFALAEEGLWEAAVPFLARAHSLDPRDNCVTIGLGRCQARLGRLHETRRLFSMIRSPTALDFLEMGSARREAGQWQQAEGDLLAAERLSPTGEWIHLELGLLYLNSGRLDDAGRELKRELADHPMNAYAATALATFYNDSEDFAKADAYAQRARVAGASEAGLTFMRGRVPDVSTKEGWLSAGRDAWESGHLRTAERRLRRSLEIGESSGEAAIDLTFVLEAQQRYREADEVYPQARRNALRSGRVFPHLVYLMWAQGWHGDLQQGMRRAEELLGDPTAPKGGLYGGGNTKRGMACSWYSKAVGLRLRRLYERPKLSAGAIPRSFCCSPERWRLLVVHGQRIASDGAPGSSLPTRPSPLRI